MSEEKKYRAPALEKGLEILELLAPSAVPMATSEISAALGRSISEIFRMIQVLEDHGYICRSGEGYRVTNRLFALGMAQPPIRDLLSQAVPAMHELANFTRQSCHLAMASGAEMVVVANVEAPGLLGFAVRMGYRRPLIHSASGHMLMAFQSDTMREDSMRATETAHLPFSRKELLARLDAVRAQGTITMPSPMLTAITDVSAPILRNGKALAALTIPFVDGPGATVSMEETTAALIRCVHAISQAVSDPV
ncbi:IclR family transcriptional regulator [Novosphingobium terrae]|uniref:IclR family transcriptional regulator n=1 Tax=Novosphingobium terrae TaxID=2726189 RepID=UPI00197EBFC5|nr:IclR family transcriptional regulator [Novosphingobium terrae]